MIWDRFLFFVKIYSYYLPVGLANVLSEGSLHYSSCLLKFAARGNSWNSPSSQASFFFVSLSGKQNNNNDNKKRNISFASWGFITWIFDSLIDNSEVLISCLLDTAFFLMSSDLETARFSWTKINYSFILYLFQGVFFRYHQAGFRSTVNFFAVMGLIFLADVFFIENFSMYPAKKKINDLKLQKIIIFILFNKVLIQ